MVQNCSSCVGGDYAFHNGSNVAFLYKYTSSYAECLTTCPVLAYPAYTTQVGFYGSFVDNNCYPCPNPCSNCDISLIRSQYPQISCGSDRLCLTGLKCTTCLLGYALVAGKCVS